MVTDNSARHATYRMRAQPDRDETDLEVLHDHIQVLRSELRRVAGGRAPVRMRTKTDPRLLHAEIEQLNELLANAYIALSCAPGLAHRTECAVNQAPAFRLGRCDCGQGGRKGAQGTHKRSA
jgi:hypothetical protein